ncbi:MAG: hypothetical protein ACP6IS_11670 [Candidatus Asgardarchaeia archaeon]
MLVLSNNRSEKIVFLKKEKRLSSIQDTFESGFELGIEVAYSVLAESKNLDEATKKILVIISRIKEEKRSKIFDFYGI